MTLLLNTSRIDHLFEDLHKHDPKLILHNGDITGSTGISILFIQDVEIGCSCKYWSRILKQFLFDCFFNRRQLVGSRG